MSVKHIQRHGDTLHGPSADGKTREGKRLFVGNLRFDLGEQELRKVLAPHVGVEDVEIVKDRHTRESRGFAFVDLISMADAAAAIDTLDGTELHGRILRVAVANPREARNRRRATSDATNDAAPRTGRGASK